MRGGKKVLFTSEIGTIKIKVNIELSNSFPIEIM